MDCLEFREKLPHHAGRRLPENEECEARLHRERCPCCDRRARYEERFESVLRERLASRPAPEGLQDRICACLAREEPSGRIRRMIRRFLLFR